MTLTSMNAYPITAVLSYLLGSIPFGYLLVRVFRGEDVRSSGSGNIGATNVARRSPALGVATLLLDAGKGFAAVLLAKSLFPEPHQPLLLTTAAFFAVLGHMFPVWLKFRGGKGVATGFGSFALIAPKSILCMVGIFVVVVAILRYVSLGSVIAAALLPILAWGLHEYVEPKQLLLLAAASMLIIWKHRQNLARIAAGTESKVGAKLGAKER
jgi:glycerol-3-phosphate acyltransferase PlsY